MGNRGSQMYITPNIVAERSRGRVWSVMRKSFARMCWAAPHVKLSWWILLMRGWARLSSAYRVQSSETDQQNLVMMAQWQCGLWAREERTWPPWWGQVMVRREGVEKQISYCGPVRLSREDQETKLAKEIDGKMPQNASYLLQEMNY